MAIADRRDVARSARGRSTAGGAIPGPTRRTASLSPGGVGAAARAEVGQLFDGCERLGDEGLAAETGRRLGARAIGAAPLDAEQIEDLLAMFSEMGVKVVETEDAEPEDEGVHEESDDDEESEDEYDRPY